jgi:hypothetical protein
MTEQILKSDKLAALQLQKTQLRPRIKRWNDERIRLARILSPQYLDITVSRVDDVAKETASKAGATAATGEDATETARRAEALQRTLAGQQVANGESVEIQLRNANLQLQALEDAMEFLDKEIRVEKKLLAIAYSKTMKPKHDDRMRRLCASLLNTHAIWTELFSLKRNLIEAEVGLIGLCLIEPSFLGVPVDPYSDCADFFRAAKKDGFVDAVPKALVLPR